MQKPLSILVALFGTEGDMRPLLWLAHGMAARGHRITVHVNPRYRSLVEPHGYRVIELGTIEQFHAVLNDPRMWTPVEGTRLVLESMIDAYPLYRESLDASGERFDLAIGTALASGALAWAEGRNVPRLLVALWPYGVRSAYDCPLYAPPLAWLGWMPPWFLRAAFALTDLLAGREFLDPINAHRTTLGLRALPSFDALTRDADAIAALFPSWYAKPQPDWPAHLAQLGFPWPQAPGPPLGDAIERFLAAGEAPIAWTHGSANVQVEEFARAARGATRRLRARAIFVGPVQDGDADFLCVPYAPFDRLLPRCRAVVHHGGIGTTVQSFAAGTPQLIVPRAHDQFDNAVRVERIGAGAQVAFRRLDVAGAAAALRDLTASSQVRAACRRTRALMAAESPLPSACDLAERIAGRGAQD
ncbi:MAG TPA: glycosyltransferase [Casimicrobiaceae bacterium]|nr:glycosyltransferase [Casimicrobiaceae bacterium]